MDVHFHIKDILQTAKQFWKEVGDQKVFAFHGAMGAGKTTFIHALCDVKKVTSTIGSPTFSLVNEYSYPGGLIYHIDLYRLSNEEEAVRAGIEDCLYSDHICMVEWPEKAMGLFPEGTVHVYLEVNGDDNRRIQIGNK